MPTDPDNVLVNKAGIIERALRRMKEEFDADPRLENFTHLDAMILNIERACQSAIDMALHVTAQGHLGIPQNSADAFLLLEKSGHISPTTARAMVGMTGFRNIAIHQYQALDSEILRTIAASEYQSLIDFCAELGVRIVPF